MDKNLPLHIVIENEVNEIPFGQLTFNVELQNGIALIETLNIVKNKRKRYSGKDIDKEERL